MVSSRWYWVRYRLSDVTVTIEVPEGRADDIEVSHASLTFTMDNWDDAQEVTVTATDDDVDADKANVVLAISADGGGYSDIVGDDADDVTVDITDNDVAGVTLTGLVGREVREGGSVSYQVVLDTEPANNVSILVTAGTYNATFNFTTNNWSTAQSGTITAPDDDGVNASRAQTVGVTIAGYNSADGSAVTHAGGTFQVRDKGAAEVIVSLTDLSIAAGASDSYNLSLTQAPAAGETVTITVGTTGQIGINPTSVELNAGNWENGVDVTLSPLASATAATDVSVTNAAQAVGGGTDAVYSADGDATADDLTTQPSAVSVDITASGS